MRAVPLALALALAALAACGRTPPPPLPDADAIGRDLVGTRFAFFEDEEGEKHWTIEEGEVQEVRLIDGVPSADGRSYRARVATTLAAQNRTIRGELHVYYRLRDGRWAYDEAVRAGDENFAVEEIAAILYAASPAQASPGDSLHSARDVRLEPIARFAEGAYTAPFDPYADEIDAVLGRSYADLRDDDDDGFERPDWTRADSLRRAAVSALEDRIATRYFNRAWTLFLIQPGKAPEPVRVRTRRAGFDGCRYLDGTVRAASDTDARAARLATTSSTMGGRVGLGRPLVSEEERPFVRIAREAFRAHGVGDDRLNRLRTGDLYAADLDGDGIEAWVGSFSVRGADAADPAEHLVLVVTSPTTTPQVQLERFASFDGGAGALDLVGLLDVDGDGRAELVLRERGYETHRYVVLSRPGPGAWQTVFEGGGGGC